MNKIIQYIRKETSLSEPEAWWLLQHVTNKSKEQLIINSKALSSKEEENIQEAIYNLTVKKMPLGYVLQSVPFLDLTISVEAPILIPRQETEEWINNLIEQLSPHKNDIHNILDIGTGSGCIALALAHAFPQAHIHATDINEQALKLAQKNAQQNNIKNITFLRSNLFEDISSSIGFDLIVSNPPYINPKHIDNISEQVVAWEDHSALFAQNSGLQIIEQLFAKSQQYLYHNSLLPTQLVIEFDYDQKKEIQLIAKQYNWNITIQKDSFNNDRTTWCSIKN